MERLLHRLSAVIGVPYWTLMHLAGHVPADDADPGEPPARRSPAATAGDGATNERLLELLEEIRTGVHALQAAARTGR